MAAETKIINPYDNRIIAAVPLFDEPQVRAAVERANRAAARLAQMANGERAALLYRTSALIEEEADVLARVIVRESGKPLRLAQAEIGRAIGVFRLAAGEAGRPRGEMLDGSTLLGAVDRIPVGVVAAFTPFDSLLGDLADILAPALAAGCPVVHKPPFAMPLTALRLTDLLENAGLPDGAFEIVLGDVDAASWLAGDARVAQLAFTGSVGDAAALIRLAGLRPVSLHLRRRAAAIVSEDADVDRAAACCAASAFAYSGQMDTCTRHIYIQRSLYDSFRDRFLDAAAALVSGDPMQPTTDLGPLISDAAAVQVMDAAKGAMEEGAWLLAGGEREGRMVMPLVFENLDPATRIMQTSVRGPLVCLLPFDQIDEALDACGETGLHLALFTADLERGAHLARCTRAASVSLNTAPDRYVSAAGVRRAVDTFTTLKTMVLNTRL